MSAELEDFEEQLNGILEGVKGCLAKEMLKLKGAERIEKCSYLRNRLNRCKQLLQSINLEIRSLKAELAVEWTEKAKQIDVDIRQLVSDVEWAEKSTPANEINKPKSKVSEPFF